MSFSIYLLGFLILIIGLAYGAYVAGVSSTWITVGVICLAGIALLKGVKNTGGRDRSL
ncbi:MAG: hypothetical protein K2X35_06630 [Bryobacteraceae bacterium]|nr:hypothetical protein [Bryobacteraceae bacterium]